MSLSRQILREQLALALAPGYTSAQAVYDHLPGKLDGSPAVAIRSSNSDRSRRDATAGPGVSFTLEVLHLVRYADPAAGWTEEHAEDALDALDYQLATFMEDKANTKGAYWKSLRYQGPSRIFTAALGGVSYTIEMTPILVITA